MSTNFAYFIFECCGTRAWKEKISGVESFFWNLKENKSCPCCGKRRKLEG